MAHTFDHYPDNRAPSPANSNYSHHSDYSQQTRPREPSNFAHHKSSMSMGGYPSPQKPIDEAVNTAFDKAQHDSPNAIPPDLIAQITQNVIKQLQTGGLEGAPPTPVPPPQSTFIPPPPQTAIHHPAPQSPSTTASGSSPNMPHRVLTPPSPQKHPDYVIYTSPDPSVSEHTAEGPRSPQKEGPTHFSPQRVPSPSQESDVSEKEYHRPKGPTRLSTGNEMTTLEKIWGQLFDEDAQPTPRIGQLLRGLAVHIIEDYEPRHSIVITPHKMAKYYEDVKLTHEMYPWKLVFDDEHTSISRMYRDLECQHHLVQERHDERPDIPGLTPVGFQKWATVLIQAHPEAEFERLQKAVLEMPISNPDDKKERFPKEISRRLFPKHEDLRIRHRIEDSIAEHAAIELPRTRSHDSLSSQSQARSHSRQPSPPHKHSTASENPYVPQSHRPSVSFAEPAMSSAASSTHMPAHIERERKPYANMPIESLIDDVNSPISPPSNPNIERERKPYSALPGGGKSHEDEMKAPKPRAESVINNSTRPSRSESVASRARPIPMNNGGPPRSLDPKPEIHHHRAPSNLPGRRQRSPSFSRGSTNDFRRSESDIRGYQSTFEPGSMPRDGGVSGGAAVFDESDTRRYFDQQAKARAERARRQTEEEARHYGESPRQSYDRDRDRHAPRRADHVSEEDFYRASGGRGDRDRDRGNGYEYQQPHGGPVYR